MTQTFRAHFDGKVFIPDEPVDVPLEQPLQLTVHGGAGGEVVDPLAGLSIEERVERIRSLAGHYKGPSVPLEAFSRENLYEERW
jgi:hypothetical protein